MKKYILLLTCLYGLTNVNAQIAKWLIPPHYDKIKLMAGIDGVLTDSCGIKAVWTMDGHKILTSKSMIYPYQEGMAVAVLPVSNMISAIYDAQGRSINITGCSMACAYPYFSYGKLLVGEKDYYRYVDKDGKLLDGKYILAFPYFHGFASCDTYLNWEKRKDLVHLLIDKTGKAIEFTFQDKKFDVDDAQFISSFNDENIAIIVLKGKVYSFDALSKQLSPVFANDDPVKKLKEQAKLPSDFKDCFQKNTDSTYVLTAKCNKDEIISISFDKMYRPFSITRNGSEHVYKVHYDTPKSLLSNLKTIKDGNYYGFAIEGSGEMLPTQFEDVLKCFGNKALVKSKGKYGMLEILPDMNFKIKINNGDPIAFRHQKFPTLIRTDFPSFLSGDKVSLEVDSKSGLIMDKTSKEWKNTENGNYVQYNCELSIPTDLPDELKDIEYPTTILYDGIKSSSIPLKVKAWHYKYFNADLDDEQTTISNGTISFVLNINAERISGESIYPTTVKIVSDSLNSDYEKISETRYKCKVHALNEGLNEITVQIEEQGCPPTVFPFEVEYHKPVAKSKGKTPAKERATIKKKEKIVKPVEPQPHVIM